MSSTNDIKNIQKDFDLFILNMTDSFKKQTRKILTELSNSEKRCKEHGFCFYGKSYILVTEEENGIPPFPLSRIINCTKKKFYSSCDFDGKTTLFSLEYEDYSIINCANTLSVGVYFY